MAKKPDKYTKGVRAVAGIIVDFIWAPFFMIASGILHDSQPWWPAFGFWASFAIAWIVSMLGGAWRGTEYAYDQMEKRWLRHRQIEQVEDDSYARDILSALAKKN